MKILVIGGTGLVGTQVVKELSSRNIEVSVLTRKAGNVSGLPKEARLVRGDILNPLTVKTIFRNMNRVFMLNPLSLDETSQGMFAVNGMRTSRIDRIVYMSVHQLEKALYLPHFGSKLAIEQAIKNTGIPYTILRPNNFYQNDYWSKDPMTRYGIYPQPLGNIGLSRVDIRDIAEAAAIALTTDNHVNETYNLVGPDVITGPETAEIWSKALGRPIKYAGDDLDKWEQESLQYMSDWMAFELKLMYSYLHKHGLKAEPEDLERVTKLLGHAPRPYKKFVEEMAVMWRSSSV
ncbi:MAG: SDR family oxidoreductase [Balneolaceae bacterium]